MHVPVVLWARRVWPRVARAPRATAATVGALACVPGITRALTLATHDEIAGALHAASMVELTVAVIAFLPLVALELAARWRSATVGRAVTKATPARSVPATTPPADPPALARRDVLHAAGGATVLGATGLLVGRGAVHRFDIEIREVPVRIPGLPRALDGYVIAQVSDLHAGVFMPESRLRAGLARVRELKADMLVATGDLCDVDPREAPVVARALMDVAPRDGAFAILGNHDYYSGAADVGDALRAAGVSLLVNDGRVVRAGDGGGFALLGLDDQWARRHGGRGPDPARASASVPRDLARILLAHQPSTVLWAARGAALQLSGHTHGGQIRPADLTLPFSAGLYRQGETALYVNRGFGVAGPPVRLGVPAEITKVILVAA
jgi:predicted MPP superfamily phosphohydrolase